MSAQREPLLGMLTTGSHAPFSTLPAFETIGLRHRSLGFFEAGERARVLTPLGGIRGALLLGIGVIGADGAPVAFDRQGLHFFELLAFGYLSGAGPQEVWPRLGPWAEEPHDARSGVLLNIDTLIAPGQVIWSDWRNLTPERRRLEGHMQLRFLPNEPYTSEKIGP